MHRNTFLTAWQVCPAQRRREQESKIWLCTSPPKSIARLRAQYGMPKNCPKWSIQAISPWFMCSSYRTASKTQICYGTFPSTASCTVQIGTHPCLIPFLPAWFIHLPDLTARNKQYTKHVENPSKYGAGFCARARTIPVFGKCSRNTSQERDRPGPYFRSNICPVVLFFCHSPSIRPVCSFGFAKTPACASFYFVSACVPQLYAFFFL